MGKPGGSEIEVTDWVEPSYDAQGRNYVLLSKRGAPGLQSVKL